jgi:hypothetical protein
MEEPFIAVAESGPEVPPFGSLTPNLARGYGAGVSVKTSRPNRSRTNWPMFDSPLSLIEVARASPRCELCAQTMTLGFAIVEGRADIKECFKHVRVSQVPGLIAPVKH